MDCINEIAPLRGVHIKTYFTVGRVQDIDIYIYIPTDIPLAVPNFYYPFRCMGRVIKLSAVPGLSDGDAIELQIGPMCNFDSGRHVVCALFPDLPSIFSRPIGSHFFKNPFDLQIFF